MFDVLICFGFASLIVRFSRVMKKAEDNVDRTTEYIEQAQSVLRSKS
jgi:hypothetical protein